MELLIERREKLRGSLRFIRAVPEKHRLALALALPVGCLFLGVRAVNSWAWQGSLNRNKKASRYGAFHRYFFARGRALNKGGRALPAADADAAEIAPTVKLAVACSCRADGEDHGAIFVGFYHLIAKESTKYRLPLLSVAMSSALGLPGRLKLLKRVPLALYL
jgi:hypothetical protein